MSFADLVYNQIIPFIDGYVIQTLYAVAFLFFIFGMFRFFFTGGEENRQRGKQFAVWGLLGLVILFSVWGLVQILLGSVFPGDRWGGSSQNGLGNRPSGSVCTSGTQCRSGVCTLRGVHTSSCE